MTAGGKNRKDVWVYEGWVWVKHIQAGCRTTKETFDKAGRVSVRSRECNMRNGIREDDLR